MNKLIQCAKWAERYDKKGRLDILEQIKNLREYYDGLSTAADIREKMWNVE